MMLWSDVNVWAVLVAAVMNLVIGGIWYSPLLFAKSWQHAAGLSDDQLKAFNPAKVFGLTLIFSLVVSANLAMFLAGSDTTWQWGATAGFLAGFGWATLLLWVICLFEQRSWRYMLIHGGYLTLYMTAAGALIGFWR